MTDYEVIHSILLKGVTTKVEEEGEHGIGLFGVVEEMKHSGGWTTKIDWKTKETAAKYKPPVSIEQVKDPDGNVIGTKFTLRMKSTDTPRFLLEYPRTMIAKMRAIEPESIVQEALVESAMQTEAGNPMTPMEVATAKLQARLESLGLQGKKLEDALSKKLEEVQRVMPEQAEPERAIQADREDRIDQNKSGQVSNQGDRQDIRDITRADPDR